MAEEEREREYSPIRGPGWWIPFWLIGQFCPLHLNLQTEEEKEFENERESPSSGPFNLPSKVTEYHLLNCKQEFQKNWK